MKSYIVIEQLKFMTRLIVFINVVSSRNEVFQLHCFYYSAVNLLEVL